MESSCPPTWSAAPCRNDAEERPLSTRTRSRCSDCFRWNLACLASGRAMAFGRAWTQTGSRTCRRAAVRYCSPPPSVACPEGSQLQPRTPSRIIQRICQRPRSDSVDRCCFESPRSRSAVSNARPPVSFIRRQSNGIAKLRRKRKKERSSRGDGLFFGVATRTLDAGPGPLAFSISSLDHAYFHIVGEKVRLRF